MKIYKCLAVSALLFFSGQAFCAEKIAASLPDLGSIAANVGGDKAEIFSIAKGNANPHSVEILPSYMIKIAKSDIYLKAGLSLDQWSDRLIDGAGNGNIIAVDCSQGIDVLEKGLNADASGGHVHPDGNPHYWLDPLNGVIIAQNIKD
ncbi:MAG: metal ABC transporter substrate-binding protein, partial [Endomicrobium sp.]|nr:metal ABC transporter substrate-binding protein [Endomicrobium sp.]